MDIYNLFQVGLTDKASSKTMRYFVGGNSFESDCMNVIYTFLTVRSKGRNNAKITVDGEEYLVNEYMFTPNMNKLIAAAKVYATADAVGANTVYNLPAAPEAKSVTVKKGDEAKVESAKLLSPEKVKNFFLRYNEAQGSSESIVTENVKFADCHLLMFKALCADKDNKFVKFNESGDYDENVALLNGVKFPLDAKYVDSYSCANEEVMAAWLVS